jgi:transglutaminase-like putative cysteine protease
MLYRVTHCNSYRYSEAVSLCHNLLHLHVRQTPRQVCRHSQFLIQPLPGVSNTRTDYFGNPVMFFTVQEPHKQLSVTAVNLVEVQPQTLPAESLTLPWEAVRYRLAQPSADYLQASQFVFDSFYVKRQARLADYARPSFAAGRPIMEAVLDLTRRIHADFKYDKTATTIATPVVDVFEHRHGVCQDFAHLEISCLRSLGLAARYVSGYLLTNPPPGQRRLIGVDASHAWLSVFCPDFGWLDVDPTNDQVPTDKHIVLAWGRDYDDISPIKGVILGGGSQEVSVSVDVAPVSEGA